MNERWREEARARLKQQQDDRAAWKAGGGLFRDTTIFSSLDVAVKGGDVWRSPLKLRPTRLGPLAGAEAVITDGTRVHRVKSAAAGGLLLGPVGLVPILTKKAKAVAMVVFADGTVHQQQLDGNAIVRKAQAEAVRFNALVAAQPATANAEQPSADPDLTSQDVRDS